MRAALRSIAFRLRADFLGTNAGVSESAVSEEAASASGPPKERRRVAFFFFVIFGRGAVE